MATEPPVTAQDLRDKIHGTDSAGPVSPVEGHSGGFRYASPATQLPVELQPGFDGEGPCIEVRVTDDLQTAQEEEALAGCTLGIWLPQLVEVQDEVSSEELASVRFRSQRAW